MSSANDDLDERLNELDERAENLQNRIEALENSEEYQSEYNDLEQIRKDVAAMREKEPENVRQIKILQKEQELNDIENRVRQAERQDPDATEQQWEIDPDEDEDYDRGPSM
jgi:chromosome segregation ATPase